MTPRNTSTGAVLEAMILPALARGGYEAVKQQTHRHTLRRRSHKVDAIATRGDERDSRFAQVAADRRHR